MQFTKKTLRVAVAWYEQEETATSGTTSARVPKRMLRWFWRRLLLKVTLVYHTVSLQLIQKVLTEAENHKPFEKRRRQPSAPGTSRRSQRT